MTCMTPLVHESSNPYSCPHIHCFINLIHLYNSFSFNTVFLSSLFLTAASKSILNFFTMFFYMVLELVLPPEEALPIMFLLVNNDSEIS